MSEGGPTRYNYPHNGTQILLPRTSDKMHLFVFVGFSGNVLFSYNPQSDFGQKVIYSVGLPLTVIYCAYALKTVYCIKP